MLESQRQSRWWCEPINGVQSTALYCVYKLVYYIQYKLKLTTSWFLSYSPLELCSLSQGGRGGKRRRREEHVTRRAHPWRAGQRPWFRPPEALPPQTRDGERPHEQRWQRHSGLRPARTGGHLSSLCRAIVSSGALCYATNIRLWYSGLVLCFWQQALMA